MEVIKEKDFSLLFFLLLFLYHSYERGKFNNSEVHGPPVWWSSQFYFFGVQHFSALTTQSHSLPARELTRSRAGVTIPL